MTSGTATRRRNEREEHRLRATTQDASVRRRRRGGAAWALGLVVVTGLVVAGLLSAQPTESADVRVAPPFTLESTDGATVSLADFRGSPVVLYFNEGAGCDSCLIQMAEIERDPGFAEAGIRVLPIVMNPREQIAGEMERLGVQTPFLLDDGSVSDVYGTLGAGMHEGLPGHGFVLIDGEGVQQWYGNYPSMWLAPVELLELVLAKL